jgi:putative endonuclease
MHFCYIIYSDKIDRYYIGETEDFTNRLEMHNSGFSPFTSKAKDWKLQLLIQCSGKSTSLKIERHIKSMKSRVFIENLIRYPDMVDQLLKKFTA